MHPLLFVTQIISGILGSIGFAMLFNLKRDKFLYISIGSFVSIFIYLLLFNITQNTFFSNLIAAFTCTTLAEIFARWRKAPATLFIIAHMIPLVPGGSLYYTMRGFVQENAIAFKEHALNTLYASTGIALGIIVVTSIKYLLIKRQPCNYR
ncbi:MAG: threonine/serine exporter family protein [Lachnospiraceae bacterium]